MAGFGAVARRDDDQHAERKHVTRGKLGAFRLSHREGDRQRRRAVAPASTDGMQRSGGVGLYPRLSLSPDPAATGREAVYQSLRRRLLVVEEDGMWRLRVPLMARWLCERG